MGTMDTNSASIPIVTIQEENGSDLSNSSGNFEARALSQGTDDVDGGVNRSDSYNMAIENGGENSPLISEKQPIDSSCRRGRFSVSKSPDINNGDFDFAVIQPVFQNMESARSNRKPKPELKLDIDKANKKPHDKVKFDVEAFDEGRSRGPGGDPAGGDTVSLSVVNELEHPRHVRRKPSKLFTVINYGNVSTEHLPTSPPISAHPEFDKFSWPKRQSLLHSSQPNMKDIFRSSSHGKLHHADTRRSSLLLTSRHQAPKPRIRIVSGTYSYNVPESRAEDIISLNSYKSRSTSGSHHQLYQRPHLASLSDVSSIASKPDILPQISEGTDIIDNKYAVETCRGSIGHMSKTLIDVAKRGRLFAKRKVGRLILKDGTPNIALKNIKTRHRKFMLDIFTTVLDMKWRWVLFLFCIAFILSWLAFAGVWLLISYIHGDMDGSSEFKCVDNVDSFYTALLYSIETQHTIGYGTRSITSYCPPTLVVFMLQSIFGVIIQCILAGIIFAKLAKPKHRAETIMFSKNAVICKRDGEYCLIFRVADMRSSQLIGATLHAMFIKTKITEEGEVMPFHQHHMEIKTESEEHDQFIFLAWPIRIVHHIDEKSPLWNTSAEQLLTEDFEIIVILEGCIESSGMTTQIRTSYLPCEILWGQTFSCLQTSRSEFGKQEINYSNFQETLPGEMPDCSAKEYYEKYQEHSAW